MIVTDRDDKVLLQPAAQQVARSRPVHSCHVRAALHWWRLAGAGTKPYCWALGGPLGLQSCSPVKDPYLSGSDASHAPVMEIGTRPSPFFTALDSRSWSLVITL